MKNLDNKILAKEIKTTDDAKAFIDHLVECDKMFHFDDDPCDIGCFNTWEAIHTTIRMDEIFELENPDWGEFEDAYGYGLFKLNNNY